VIHAPALGETFTATLGGGATLHGRAITASDTADLDDASVLADARLIEGPHWLEPWPAMRFEKRNAIAYRMALVAAGAFDAAINLTPKWDWDVCAGALIVEEAGGRVSDHHGHAWRFNQADPRQNSLVCSAPALHPLIVRRTAPIPLAPR
jgi:myo-inositol-1(or 4)-monophosphatase